MPRPRLRSTLLLTLIAPALACTAKPEPPPACVEYGNEDYERVLRGREPVHATPNGHAKSGSNYYRGECYRLIDSKLPHEQDGVYGHTVGPRLIWNRPQVGDDIADREDLRFEASSKM